MSRKRLTQIMPWLAPLRKKQRVACFYAAMNLQGGPWASEQRQERLAYPVFGASSGLYNPDTGFDMVYQENKVFNLKLAAKTLDGLVIRPGESFSFWRQVRHADRRVPYREGLVVKDGCLQTVAGGGVCQLSNLLFWLFLHTPLTVTERHSHAVRDFPDAASGLPLGVDATVTEGWRDLRARNDCSYALQIGLAFDQERLYGGIWAAQPPASRLEVEGGQVVYRQEAGRIYEEAEVIRSEYSIENDRLLDRRLLYTNRCEIGYELPDTVEVAGRPDIAGI